MIQKFDNAVFSNDYMASDIVTFFSNNIGLNSVNLNNINLDDVNFDDYDPKTINRVRFMP